MTLLSFDLDGVVCDTDSSFLGLLHDMQRAGTVSVGQLEHYYLSRHMLLDPRNFCAEDDSLMIITARNTLAVPWTEKWLDRWLPEAGRVYVTTELIEALFADGQYAEASRLAGERKAEVILRSRVEVHLDNNPFIVAAAARAWCKGPARGTGDGLGGVHV